MSVFGTPPVVSRDSLLGYFLAGAVPRSEWKIGVEVEKLGRRAADGLPLVYAGVEPSVRAVLGFLLDERGGDPVYEADNLIGVDAPWGTLSLEPGGQLEWSSRPRAALSELAVELRSHLDSMARVAAALGVHWLDVALDPTHPVSAMPWMPKARYRLMRAHLGRRGRLAHRMMTQTASVQCAFDYSDPEDWRRKLLVSARLAPVAAALFANSSRIDGAESGWRSYRHAIWRETDPDRCGLPACVFEPGFDLERWLDWMLSVPTLFLHRARGLVPAGGVPFARLLERTGCDAVRTADWETHASTIFTEVRCYTYLEIRGADLQPDELCLAVPAFWAGILYDDGALDQAIDLVPGLDRQAAWSDAMLTAARDGLDATLNGEPLRTLTVRALGLAARGLRSGAGWVGPGDEALLALQRLARKHDLRLD